MISDTPSCCWNCRFVASCDKQVSHTLANSLIYKGFTYISSCSSYRPYKEIITLKQISEMSGINRRTIVRWFEYSPTYAINKIKSISGLEVSFKKHTKRRVFYLKNRR